MLNWLHKIIHKKNKTNNIGEDIGKDIIEDKILPIQVMIYSIEKFK